jgi:hypothetical protein
LRDRLEDRAANASVLSCVNASLPDKSAVPDSRLQYPVQHDATRAAAVTRDSKHSDAGGVANADMPYTSAVPKTSTGATPAA